MSAMDKHPLYEYTPPEFTPEQRRFLAAVGWATVEAGDVVDEAATLLRDCPPDIERVTYLTREVLGRGLFAERRRAYSFAQSYVALADAGTDFRLLVWDWE